jgi:hypothetical protein
MEVRVADNRRRRDFTREEAARLLAYDPLTGVVRWLIEANSHGGKIYPGDEAGTLKDGYIHIWVFGLVYRAQHLAWLFMTGEWPDPRLDVEHRDRNRANNAWTNLRPATRSQNNMNASLRSDNRSGTKGVSRVTKTGKWHARIVVNGKHICLGDFTNLSDAVAVRKAAEIQHFGEFAAA